jgi:hypothetical protein
VFSFNQNLGKGQITYLNLPFLDDELAKAPTDVKQSILSKLGDLLKVIKINLPKFTMKTENSIEPINYVKNKVVIEGKVEIESESVLFNDLGTGLVAINLTRAGHWNITNGKNISLFSSQEMIGKLLDIKLNGYARMLINTYNMTINSGNYNMLELGNQFTVNVDLEEQTILNIGLLINDVPIELSVEGGTVSLKITNTNNSKLSVYAKNPKIYASGKIFMELAYLSERPGTIIAYDRPLVVLGNMIFRVNSVDQNIIRISDISIDGEKAIISLKKMWDQWNIPWRILITSQYYLLLIILAFSILFGIFFLKITFLQSRFFNKMPYSHSHIF